MRDRSLLCASRRGFWPLLLAASAGWALTPGAAASRVDLTDPVQRLDAYIRVVGDTSGKPTAEYATATVYGYVTGDKPRALFRLEVVGVGRFERRPDGYQRLHREIGYYTDLKTGEVLKRWFNPWLQREVEVIPIQNDPVNRRFTVQNQTFQVMEEGDDVVFYREVPLRYPNVLDRATYPLHSSGDFYEAMEMFNSFARRRDLDNPRLTAVPATGSWSRFGPWLPWMEMGAHPGQLIYHSRSIKPANGVAGLPPRLRELIARDNPKFLEAPRELTQPDETSWTYFKKVIDARRAPRP
jgi:hypothetical protein